MVQIDPPLPTDFASPAYPARILDRKLINFNNAANVSVLVQWEGRAVEDASWINYDTLRRTYPQFASEDAAAQERGIVTTRKPIPNSNY